ncbi:MAG: 16S rRNA (guanine(527)-N(7))-methyltransferase RsmG [Candidatus Binatia bacterium]
MRVTHAHIHFLHEGAKNLEVELTDEALSQFSIYLEELLFWSPKIDLISQTDPALIIRKHFLDSIAVIPYLQKAASILDLGSGAGFPGIPLAIVLPQTFVTLIEARRKRVSFLKHVARRIAAKNLAIREGRVEELTRDSPLQEAFDVVITRATWKISTLLKFACPFLRMRGKVLAMKGPRSNDESPELSVVEGEFIPINCYDYVLPFGSEQRRLLGFCKNVPRDT